MFRKFVSTLFSSVAVVPAVVSGLSQPSQTRAAMSMQPQTRIDGLVEYTEYLLAIAALFFAWPMYRYFAPTVRHAAQKPKIVKSVPVTRPVAVFKSPVHKQLLPTEAIPATETRTHQSEHRAKAKTHHREDKSRYVKGVLQQKQVERKVKQAASKMPAPSQVKTPSVTSKKPVTAIKAAPTQSASVVASTPVAAPKGLSLSACAERVNTAIRSLAAFAKTHAGDVEIKLDERDERVRHLVALQHLHHYNLTVLQLQAIHANFRNRDYHQVMMPLRLVFAHYSTAMEPAHVLQDIRDLSRLLQTFVEKHPEPSALQTIFFINQMSDCLRTSSLLVQHRERRAENKPNTRTLSIADQQALVAYQVFVTRAIPELQYLADKWQNTDEKSTAEPFSKREYAQALNHRIMMSFDNLLLRAQRRLQQKTALGDTDAFRLMTAMRSSLRNQVAHHEPLSAAQLQRFCDRLSQFSANKEEVLRGEQTQSQPERPLGLVKTLFGAPSGGLKIIKKDSGQRLRPGMKG